MSDLEKPAMPRSREKSIPGCRKIKCKDGIETNMSHERKVEVGQCDTQNRSGMTGIREIGQDKSKRALEIILSWEILGGSEKGAVFTVFEGPSGLTAENGSQRGPVRCSSKETLVITD